MQVHSVRLTSPPAVPRGRHETKHASTIFKRKPEAGSIGTLLAVEPDHGGHVSWGHCHSFVHTRTCTRSYTTQPFPETFQRGVQTETALHEVDHLTWGACGVGPETGSVPSAWGCRVLRCPGQATPKFFVENEKPSTGHRMWPSLTILGVFHVLGAMFLCNTMSSGWGTWGPIQKQVTLSKPASSCTGPM